VLRTAIRVRRPTLAAEAWMSIGVVIAFLGVTVWWLGQDQTIPVFDAGIRLTQAISVYERLSAGSIGTALTITSPYPPVAYLVGTLGMWVGGIGVNPAVIAENLVFVPLLALGCYNVGRLAFGARAGLLAVVFALGSPLITAQFHVFMIDAPETAMVAVTVWLILATERFSRIGISALAGVAVGLGMLTKEPFAFFVAGVVLVTLIRGGWSAWRGFVVFSILALALAVPWYLSNVAEVEALAHGAAQAAAGPSLQQGIAPPRFSLANLSWYFWNIANFQLYLPLFVFSLIGGIWTIVGFARRQAVSPFAWEITIGAFVAWVGITETFVHDTRYSMPLLLYLAVFAGGWVANLRRRSGRVLATSVLVLIALFNVLGAGFGVGGNYQITLPGEKPGPLDAPGILMIHSDGGFLVSGPKRDGDVLGLMQALRRNGVREIALLNVGPKESQPITTPDFSEAGLVAFAQIAKLEVLNDEYGLPSGLSDSFATLGHGPISSSEAPPCARLSDGTGVWVRLGDPNATSTKDYCPFRHPSFY
jgi:4-amino-4-deoxy-L-arabinose transferase-like glycosyltransferase